MAGAGAAAGALVAAPGAYQRLRTLVQPVHRPQLPAAPDPPAAEPPVPPPAAAFATYDPPEPKPPDEDTAELRLRIDETRDRIRRRAEDDALRGGTPPAGDAPPQAG